MAVKVFAIVVTYNGRQWYERCFSSLRNSSFPLQTVVVDNASKDDTVDFIKENYPEIVIIKSDKNLGFGQANNMGMRYALEHGCDFVFLLNQDAWIEPDSIAQLIDVYQNHEGYGILSPVHLNARKDAVEKLLLQRMDDYNTTDSRLFDDLFFNRLKDVYDTRYVNAAAWFLPRKTIETVGGFDPAFFHYGEDDNYLNRVFYHGFKVGLCPLIRIVHDNERIRPLYDSREDEILAMIEYTNVNLKNNINKDKLMFLRKSFRSFLKGKKQNASKYWRKYVFLKKNRNIIEKSVKTNRIAGLNWL